MKIEETNKKIVLGQYFTKKNIVDRVINLLLEYKPYNKEISVLEPSAGTKNFVKGIKEKGFNNVQECEIDESLTETPCDFLSFDLNKKFDLIIGNPPFTKYNVKDSYFYPQKYEESNKFLTKSLLKKEKVQIENAFILKSIKHLRDENSSIGFVLPISFFIAKKNKEVKEEIMKNFSTIIIYQNDKNMVEEPIPCCFAIFTNIESYKDKIILMFEDGENKKEIVDKSILKTEELIPKTFLYKKNNHQEGTPLSKFLSDNKVIYQKDYSKNNISGANILQHQNIPEDMNVEDYALAVTRVGNVSVGKSGLINVKNDILNDMFFVLGFKEEYKNSKEIKEFVCKSINKNLVHFRNITHRVGSKSIKKSEIFDFRIQEP
jgi:hypothetical protein